MKKVTITFEYYFDERTRDEICYECAMEMIQQETNDVSDEQINIEYNVKKP